MLTRKIGDAIVPAIGYGAMGVSAPTYGPTASEEEILKVFDCAYENGCTHWDTANVYGDSEIHIGKWLKRTGQRNKIFLATKFGYSPSTEAESAKAEDLDALTSSKDISFGVNGTPENVKASCNRSLERLGVDYIDLYYLHRVDAQTPIEITVGAMAELVKEGKVKYLGLSECSANALRRAHAVHPIAAIQAEYSPFVLDIEKPHISLLETARELGVAVVAYSPIGRGLLGGQIRSINDFDPTDYRRSFPKYSEENFPKVLAIVDHIKKIAEDHNITPSQATLAWIIAQGIIPIPGTRKVKYLKENIDAASITLSDDAINNIRGIAMEADKIVGDRYGPGLQETLFLDSPPLPK